MHAQIQATVFSKRCYVHPGFNWTTMCVGQIYFASQQGTYLRVGIQNGSGKTHFKSDCCRRDGLLVQVEMCLLGLSHPAVTCLYSDHYSQAL